MGLFAGFSLELFYLIEKYSFSEIEQPEIFKCHHHKTWQQIPYSQSGHFHFNRNERILSQNPIFNNDLNEINFIYLFLNDNTDLLNCSVELINVDFTFIVNVKEFKTFCKETFFTLVRWAFLHDLGFHLSLETTRYCLQ